MLIGKLSFEFLLWFSNAISSVFRDFSKSFTAFGVILGFFDSFRSTLVN